MMKIEVSLKRETIVRGLVFISFVVFFIAAGVHISGTPGVAAQGPDEIRFDCDLRQITVFQNSVWIRCNNRPSQDFDAGVFAIPISQHSANAVLTMAMNAMATDLNFQITYSQDDNDLVDAVCAMEECRLIRWTNVSR